MLVEILFLMQPTSTTLGTLISDLYRNVRLKSWVLTFEDVQPIKKPRVEM
jgi:hypothetical protein